MFSYLPYDTGVQTIARLRGETEELEEIIASSKAAIARAEAYLRQTRIQLANPNLQKISEALRVENS